MSIQGARLQKLYKSWEDNPDIGFIVMKVIVFLVHQFWSNAYADIA